MGESVWSGRADELLLRTASSEPTPGSGAAAAIAGALGIALVLKALTITDDDGCAAVRARGEALVERVVTAADADAEAFAEVIDADGDADSELALAQAAAVPLDLAAALVDALVLAREAEPLVKPTLVSDVLGGADLVRGAATVALRAAELNVASLEQRDAAEATALRQRLDALEQQLAE